MSLTGRSIIYFKEWDLNRRVLMHAILHQYALMVMETAPDEPIVKEYKLFSYQAIAGYLGDDSDEECLNNLALADEAFNTLYSSLNKSTNKDFINDPFRIESDPSFIARTHLALAPMLLDERFETLSDEEINMYLDDIEIDQEDQSCISDKIQDLAVSACNERVERLSSFMDDNPVLSWDDETLLADEDQEDIEESVQIPPSLHNIVNHETAFKVFSRIERGKGLYAPSKKPVVSSFDPKPSSDFDPSDPSTYYRNQIGYMFKTLDYNSKGDLGDYKALELCIKTWIRRSILSFNECYYDKALYITTAVLSEFVKGLSLDIVSEELKIDFGFRFRMEEYLDDTISLILLYLDYVDDYVYAKVHQNLQQLIDSEDKEVEKLLDIDFHSLNVYHNLRNASNKDNQ